MKIFHSGAQNSRKIKINTSTVRSTISKPKYFWKITPLLISTLTYPFIGLKFFIIESIIHLYHILKNFYLDLEFLNIFKVYLNLSPQFLHLPPRLCILSSYQLNNSWSKCQPHQNVDHANQHIRSFVCRYSWKAKENGAILAVLGYEKTINFLLFGNCLLEKTVRHTKNQNKNSLLFPLIFAIVLLFLFALWLSGGLWYFSCCADFDELGANQGKWWYIC